MCVESRDLLITCKIISSVLQSCLRVFRVCLNRSLEHCGKGKGMGVTIGTFISSSLSGPQTWNHIFMWSCVGHSGHPENFCYHGLSCTFHHKLTRTAQPCGTISNTEEMHPEAAFIVVMKFNRASLRRESPKYIQYIDVNTREDH